MWKKYLSFKRKEYWKRVKLYYWKRRKWLVFFWVLRMWINWSLVDMVIFVNCKEFLSYKLLLLFSYKTPIGSTFSLFSSSKIFVSNLVGDSMMLLQNSLSLFSVKYYWNSSLFVTRKPDFVLYFSRFLWAYQARVCWPENLTNLLWQMIYLEVSIKSVWKGL